jgi:hypothetical protein
MLYEKRPDFGGVRYHGWNKTGWASEGRLGGFDEAMGIAFIGPINVPSVLNVVSNLATGI